MASRQPTSRYFEESERYVREYEMKNGLGREYLDHDRRAHGTPIRTPIAPDYSRSEWPEQRYTNGRNGHYAATPARSVYPPRQSSVPPAVRRIQYNINHPPPLPAHAKRTPPSYAEYAANTDVYGALHSPQPPTVSPPTDPYFRPPADDRQFNPRSHYDSVERHRPLDRGPPLESAQPATFAAPTPAHHPQAGPLPLIPNFLQYTTRPGSPKEVVGVGEIINTETGFTIQLDVRHFSAKEIRASSRTEMQAIRRSFQVVLCGHTLTIAGERVDEDPATEQTLKRSFSRKYAIPNDVLLDSIKAHLTDFGLLLIRGNRKNWRETEIEIQIQTPDSEVNGEKPKGQPADGESKPPARSPTPPKDDRELRGPSSEVGDSVVVVQPTPILSELSLQRSKELEVHPLLVRPVVAVQYTPSKRGSHFGVV